MAFMMFFKVYGVMTITLTTLLISLSLPPHHHDNPSLRSSRIRSVVVISRHGDRTPVMEISEQNETRKLVKGVSSGQLTPRGQKRMFQLGLMLRSRYRNLIYDKADIIASSSPAHRCLDSVRIARTALEPFSNGDIGEIDILSPFGKPCPALWSTIKKMAATSQYQGFMEDYSSLKISKHFNAPIDHLFELFAISDKLLVDGMRSNVSNQFSNFSHEYLQKFISTYFCAYSSQLKVRNVIASPVFELILETFKDAAASDDGKKILIMSTHDTLLSPMLRSFNSSDGSTPNYGASIIFELHQDHEGASDFWIESFYSNDKHDFSPIRLTASMCNGKSRCTLSDFSSNLQLLNKEKINSACDEREWPIDDLEFIRCFE